MNLFLLLLIGQNGFASEIKIVKPTAGTKIKQGEAVKIVISTDLKGPIIIVSKMASATIEKPPYDYTFKVPNNVVGSVKILAAGKTDNGQPIMSKEIEVEVLPVTTLDTHTIGYSLERSSHA